MTTPPDTIPTVLVHGRYQGPDRRPLSGTVTFTAPGILTFPDADLFIAGPLVAQLDETGRFAVTLPATDSPGMNPTGWAYTVKENLSGVVGGRTYLLVLPRAQSEVDLADVAPADPSTPNYVPVPGPPGEPGRIQSVNGDSGPDVVLTADEVGALPKAGGTLTGRLVLSGLPSSFRTFSVRSNELNRWAYQVDSTPESGSDAGSNFELSNWSDAGSWKSSVLYGERSTGNLGIGTNTLAAGAKLTVQGPAALRDGVPAAGVSGAAILYSEGGTLKIRQGNNVVVPVVDAVPKTDRGAANGVATLDSSGKVPAAQLVDRAGDWQAPDLGLKGWAFDPAVAVSTGLYPGTTALRLTAVILREPTTVTSLVWHFTGYAGGLSTGSFAGLYNASGTLVAQTGELTGKLPTVTNPGGQTVAAALTAPLVVPAGIYFVGWMMKYTTSPINGPAMLVAESGAGNPPGRFGLSNFPRFGNISSPGSTLPASITISAIENGPIRFWAALA